MTRLIRRLTRRHRPPVGTPVPEWIADPIGYITTAWDDYQAGSWAWPSHPNPFPTYALDDTGQPYIESISGAFLYQ